ncbi:MAG: hydroxymethylbilane synthase, partial [Lachnospiraceae bacterium]
KELDLALRQGRSDISVHSLKDMPMELPEDLPLLGYSKRVDPRDVLVLPKGTNQLDTSLPLGSSSPRRTIQLHSIFPQMEVKSIRGNVLTRLDKLDAGEYSGLVLAAAGLIRLGLAERISRYFEVNEILPAAGQGILAVQGRKGEDYAYLSEFFQEESTWCAKAERSFVRTLGGGCSSPIAAYGVIDQQQQLVLTGLFAKEDSTKYWKETIQGPKEEAIQLGKTLAEQIKKASMDKK